MRLAFCKFNEQNQRIYFYPSIAKIQKDCGKQGLQMNDILTIDNLIGVIFMTANKKYAMTFKSKFLAHAYRFFSCISPGLKLIDLDKLEA